MALFGKNDASNAVLRKIQKEEFSNRDELEVLLTKLVAGEGFRPDRCLWMLSHPTREVRRFIHEQLLDAQINVDHLLKEIGGKTRQQRKEICQLAMKINASRVSARIAVMAYSTNEDEREAAMDMVAVHPDFERHLGILKASLKDPRREVRLRAADILGTKSSHPTVFLILRDLIHDEELEIRKLVIKVLAESGEAEIVEPFFERLPLEEEAEREVIIRALAKLSKDPRAKMEERVVPVLADENPKIRKAAVQLLQGMPNRKKVLRAFLVQTRGLAYWLRDRCFQSIGTLGQDILESLMELMQDEDEDVRVGAMNMAADSDDPRIIPAVKGILCSQSDWWVRLMAAEILAKFGDRAVVEIMVPFLEDRDLRYGIIASLGSMENPMVVPHLLKCLKDPQRGIRSVALDALAEHRDPVVLNAILEIAKNDVDGALQDKATVILENYGRDAEMALKTLGLFRNEMKKTQREELKVDLLMENDTLNR